MLTATRTSNAARGEACFIMGDVPCGVHFWRAIEPGYLRQKWQYNQQDEAIWAKGVVDDPRYQALLDDLGIGSKWRSYMRATAAELTPVLGLAAVDSSVHDFSR